MLSYISFSKYDHIFQIYFFNPKIVCLSYCMYIGMEIYVVIHFFFQI